MAYDSHATYTAPKRQYYGQTQQQNPTQNYDQGAYDDYRGAQGQSQDYGNGYASNYPEDGYGQQSMAQYDGSRTYGEQHRQPQQAPYNDYSRSEDRAYDQRYQQRREHGPGYDRNMNQSQYSPERRAPAHSNQQYRNGDGMQHDMRRGQHSHMQYNDSYGSSHQPANQYPQRGGGSQSVPPSNSAHPGNFRTTSMDDWKARERSKMHDSARSPQTRAQDNAFPTFSNGRPQDDRTSDNNARPSTAPIANNQRQPRSSQQNGRREDTSGRDYNSHGAANNRPSIDQYSISSANSGRRMHDERYNGPASPSAYGGHDDRGMYSPTTRSQSRPLPQISTQHESGQANYNALSPAPSLARYDSGPPMSNPARNHARDYTAEASYSAGQTSQRAPQIVQSPVVYGQAASLSVAGNSGYDQGYGQGQLAPPLNPSNRSSLGDFYDQYHEPNSTDAHPTQTQSREQQIESEMPNFDSSEAKRISQLQDRDLSQQNSSRQHNSNTQSISSVQSRSYPTTIQQDNDPSRYQSPMPGSRSGQSGPPNGQSSTNFSVPSGGYSQQSPVGTGPQPPRPPFASDGITRTLSNDAQQMPIRSGPPQPQRFHSNGPTSTNGPLPTFVPTQPRGASAPPGQGALHAPPRSAGMGAPNGQQPGSPGAESQANPDALPYHPVPVRPGLEGGKTSQPERPPPVRNYHSVPNNGPGPGQPMNHAQKRSVDHGRKPSVLVAAPTVTHAELDRLRDHVKANPNNPKQALLLAKMLAEAARVLANEGGRADVRTTAKNREKYINEAYKRVKKLVASGYPEAQFYLADCYGSGELGLEIDSREAFNLYQTAAKQGHPQAAYRTAVCCEIGAEDGGGIRKDYAKAVQWYRRASALGDVAAMYKLGIIQLRGMLGQQRNVGEALNWLKRSAERADADNPHALHELATLYESSNKDPEVRNKLVADDIYAHELYHRAAKFDFKTSQFRLGQAYEYGQLGLSIDNRASITWYSKAAAQGEHQAELALSGWYLTGADGILDQSDTEAYLWARKAASSEPPQPKAMFAMGYFSEQGIGCPANVDEARRWYGRAASYKFPKALERLEELKRSSKGKLAPVNGKLGRKDQKKDESECVLM